MSHQGNKSHKQKSHDDDDDKYAKFCLKCLSYELFGKEIRYNGLQFFEEKKGMFCSCFWSELANNTWFFLGFVISLRTIAMQDPQYNPQYCDQVFITFLNSLTSFSFNSFSTYMKNIRLIMNFKWYIPNVDSFIKSHNPGDQDDVKQAITMMFGEPSSIANTLPTEELHKIYSYHLRCANAYIQLWDYYTKADRDLKMFWFDKPEHWKMDCGYINPFEGFLRSKWSSQLVMLLDLKMPVETRWLNDPVKPLWDKHLKEQHACSLSAAEKGKLAPFLESAYSKNKFSSTTPASSSYDPNWPPTQPKRKQLQKENRSFFDNLKGVDEHLWRISEELLPTPLSRKFHVPQASALMSLDPKDKYYMAAGPWFAHWATAFGADALNFVQQECSMGIKGINSDVSAASKDTLNKNLLKKLQRGADILEGVRKEEFAPKSEHCITTIGEFILEPFILIQLPWNFALLNQWLALSLIEILKFELASVELRHWPLPCGEIESCSRELLSLVCHAKECVLRGLYLHCQRALDPVGSNDFPAKILDTCVLPATPALELLCSGEAYKFLDNIKQLAFTESRHMDQEKVSILPESVYTISDTRLEWFYINHKWHSFFWLDEEYKKPFPKADFELSKKVEFATPPLQASCRLSYSPFSQQEHYFIETFFSKDWEREVTDDTSEEMLRSLRTVLDLVFKQLFAFPKLFHAPLFTLFASKESENHISDLRYVHMSNLNSIQIAAASASLYMKLNSQLCGINQKDSVLAWLVRLSGEILEKEQLVRVAVACGHILNQTPALLNLQETPHISFMLMRHEVKNASSQQAVRGRAWLWKQLPSKWSKSDKPALQGMILQKGTVVPRSSGVEDKSLKVSNASSVALGIEIALSSFEARLGRLIVSAAKMNFKSWEAGNTPYQNWDSLHYILPYYFHSLLVISSRSDIESKAVGVQNLIDLIQGLLAFCERSYEYWPLVPTERKKLLKPKTDDNNLQALSVSNNEGRICTERASHLMFAFVGLGRPQYFYEGVYGFQSFAESMLQFKEPENQKNYSKPHPFEQMAYSAYESVGLPHLKFLAHTAKESWNPPAPNAQLKNEVLQKAYFANACLELFEVSLQCQEMYGSRALMLHPKYTDIVNIGMHMVYWRCELLSRVLQCEGLVASNAAAENLENFAADAQDLMFKYWSLLRAVRLSIDSKMEHKVPENLVGDAPELIRAVKLFRQGAVCKIDDLLNLTCSEKHKKDSATDMMQRWAVKMEKIISGKDSKPKPKVTLKKPEEAKSKITDKKKTDVPVLQMCRNCQKKEPRSGRFVLCEECKKTNYPDKNYFCNKKCLDAWWEEEHMAEHLEFSLGLKTFD